MTIRKQKDIKLQNERPWIEAFLNPELNNVLSLPLEGMVTLKMMCATKNLHPAK